MDIEQPGRERGARAGLAWGNSTALKAASTPSAPAHAPAARRTIRPLARRPFLGENPLDLMSAVTKTSGARLGQNLALLLGHDPGDAVGALAHRLLRALRSTWRAHRRLVARQLESL